MNAWLTKKLKKQMPIIIILYCFAIYMSLQNYLNFFPLFKKIIVNTFSLCGLHIYRLFGVLLPRKTTNRLYFVSFCFMVCVISLIKNLYFSSLFKKPPEKTDNDKHSKNHPRKRTPANTLHKRAMLTKR